MPHDSLSFSNNRMKTLMVVLVGSINKRLDVLFERIALNNAAACLVRRAADRNLPVARLSAVGQKKQALWPIANRFSKFSSAARLKRAYRVIQK